jgi:hypothetical protein
MSASIARAAVRLHDLSDGTRLSVTMTDGKVSLSAPGMQPIELALPVSDLVMTDDLRNELYNMVLSPHAARDVSRGWLWLAASLFAAEEGSGISL